MTLENRIALIRRRTRMAIIIATALVLAVFFAVCLAAPPIDEPVIFAAGGLAIMTGFFVWSAGQSAIQDERQEAAEKEELL